MLQQPQAQDWDRFWKKTSTSSPQEISLSKQRILRKLTPYLRPGLCVLDAGCGSGFFSQAFCERGCAVVALDYSKEACAATEERTAGKVTVLCADFLKNCLLDLVGSKVDLVFTDGLFEHFSASEQDKIMQNFLGVLSDSGVCITFVPNRFSPWQIIRPFFMPGIQEKPFVLSALVDLNRRNGLEVIEQGGVNVVPFPYSPDEFFGKAFGMLLYTVGRKLKK
jgi:SAM-dependent methyltransferase